jgi:hypothetical protein
MKDDPHQVRRRLSVDQPAPKTGRWMDSLRAPHRAEAPPRCPRPRREERVVIITFYNNRLRRGT